MSIYNRKINESNIDVYDILRGFNVACPATQHAIKKLLCAGQRGNKGLNQDLHESAISVERAIQLLGNIDG